MSSRDTSADVAIVGSGATGGWAAKVLTQAGLRVVVIEAGRKLDLDRDHLGDDYWRYGEHDDREHAFPELAASQPIQSRHPLFLPSNHHFFVNDEQHPYTTPEGQPFYWIRGRQEGGRSMVWGGQTWRMSDDEFKPAQPPGLDLGWPIGYQDLAPYYDEVERFLGVVGHNEGVEAVPDGIFAEPNPLSPAESRFQRFARERFARPVVTIRSVNTTNPPERYRGTTAWPRFSSPGSTLAAAVHTGKARVETDAIAYRVVVDRDSGRATGVACIDAHTRERFQVSAGAVVVCASTIETARLLLNSDPRHDLSDGRGDGLGNQAGVLGRYLSDHCITYSVGVVPESAVSGPGKPLRSWNGDGLYLPRFRNRGVQETDYYGGFGTMLLMGRTHLPIDPGILSEDESGRGVLAATLGEVIPRADNRVTLSRDVRDEWGIPAAHIDYTYSDNERLLVADASAQIREMLTAFGCEIRVSSTNQEPGIMVHEVGTARMGTSRTNSYLNAHCQSWEVPNLFVTDGAAWPTSAYQNPTLTMMALTIRACRHLSEQIHKNAL